MKKSIFKAYSDANESLSNFDLLKMVYEKILYAIQKIEDSESDDVRIRNTKFVLSAIDLLISSLDSKKVRTEIYNAYLSFYISTRKSIMYNLVGKDISKFEDIKKGIDIMLQNI